MLPAMLRIAGEKNDEWQLQHRHMQAEGMTRLVSPTIDGEATYLPSTQITPEVA